MIDSHCHLQDSRIFSAAADVVVRAEAAGVETMVLGGVHPQGWERQVQLRDRWGKLGISFGYHPQFLDRRPEDPLDFLEQWCRRHHPNAVGEVGLHRGEELELQKEAMEAQLALAARLDLPVILHVVGAHGAALDILTRADLRAGGVVHSFSGAPEVAKAYVALGLHVSFSGLVTRATARRAREAVPHIPPDRLLVETDSPDQVPHNCGQELNEPAFLREVIDAVAALRGEDGEKVAMTTAANARRLFWS